LKLGKREPPPVSEQERQENLRNRLFAFEELFSEEGTRLYKTGHVTELVLYEAVHLEQRWEPNPNYNPRFTEGEESRYVEPPYIEREVTDNLYERVLVLHALWETGTVTDAYAEARLDELSDLCSRKGMLRAGFGEAAQEAEDSYFGAQLVKLMSEKEISRSELAKRTGMSMYRIQELETSRSDPRLTMIRALAEGLEVHITEFLPNRSDG